MKEYICKEDLENLPKYNFGITLLSAEEHVKISDIVNLPTVTKADICREFFEELRTRIYQGRDTLYQDMCDKGYELLAEMEQVSVEEYDTREYAKQNPKWVEKIKRLAEMEG